MQTNARYAKNIELFARDNPLQAYRLEQAECSLMRFCTTYQKELNLVDESQKQQIYLHAQEGAIAEATYWAEKLPLENKDTLFVYGLGLGYYYLPLQKWLKDDPTHSLIFIEDNPSVVRHFLHTDLATKILKNPQVMVTLLPIIEPNEEGWAQLRLVAAPLLWAFARSKPHLSALGSYFLTRFEFFHPFALQWLTALSRAARSLAEFYPRAPLVFHNFYANLTYLGETIPGYKLANAMSGIPALLCGAGPSLLKQFPILKGLSEGVFLMASGSAINALTHVSIMPHVSGAIDPTAAQASRLLTSFAFEVPAFYQNRFFSEAFKEWHGPLLYMTGSGGYRVSEWFENELGIDSAEQLIMGVSTSNFLLEIANFLGCYPIVLVGMDLAYTGDKRYVKGISAHPSDSEKEKRDLGKKEELLIGVPGVDGKEVYITNQWFYEAVCMAAFKERNPNLTFLNATEGGMAIPSVENVAFSKVVEYYFIDSWDIQGWFHGVIQNAVRFKISSVKVFDVLDKWRGSLEACAHALDLLIGYFQNALTFHKKSKLASFSLYSGKAALWQQELSEEPAYEFFLDTLNTVFETLHALRIRSLKWSEKKRKRALELSIELERYLFLRQYVADHLIAIAEGLNAFQDRALALSCLSGKKGRLKENVLPPDYRLKEDGMLIEEPSLGLHIKAVFTPQMIPNASWPKPGQQPQVDALVGMKEGQKEGQTLFFYPDGAIKAEAFYHFGKLHGPWSFYSPEGVLLFRSWFVKGKKEGRCCAYYSSGALYSLLGYCRGLLQGKNLYYYSDGTLKTAADYEKGVLHGSIRLYHSNGVLKKEQHVVKGQLHGQERMWNEWGILILEASYEYGKVVGVSKKWHANGQLARQIVHTSQGDQVQEWDKEGNEIA